MHRKYYRPASKTDVVMRMHATYFSASDEAWCTADEALRQTGELGSDPRTRKGALLIQHHHDVFP
jgi:hypothetical protein